MSRNKRSAAKDNYFIQFGVQNKVSAHGTYNYCFAFKCYTGYSVIKINRYPLLAYFQRVKTNDILSIYKHNALLVY